MDSTLNGQTGEPSICSSCHTEGDEGCPATGGIHDRLHDLESRIARSKEILDA